MEESVRTPSNFSLRGVWYLRGPCVPRISELTLKMYFKRSGLGKNNR